MKFEFKCIDTYNSLMYNTIKQMKVKVFLAKLFAMSQARRMTRVERNVEQRIIEDIKTF